MKKTRLFAIIFLLLISWCSKDNEKVFLSFENSENIISENINFMLNENKSLFEFSNFDSNCSFKSEDSSVKLDSNIGFSGFLDQSKNERLEIYPNIYFFDKKWKNEINTSGLISNLYKDNYYYTRFSGFSIDMWKWNYESNLRYMIMENLWDKRIRFDSVKLDSTRKTQKDIKFLLNTISSSSVFQNLEQVTYEWNIAYKISIREDILDFIKEQTDIEITDFDWLFIVKSDNQVDLRINNMQVIYKTELWTKNFTINWIIWGDEWILNFSKDGEIIKIIYEKHRKYTKIEISKNINFDEMWIITTNISRAQRENSNIFNIKWDIQISPILIYWSDLENDLKIDIKCLYENFSWEVFDLTEPESYVLLSQILWDEFSIKNFIWDK